MELNTEGELNTNGASNSGGGNGVKILDFSALANGAALPSEITFTTGGGEILGGGLKPTDTSTGGGDYFEVDSLADGKFVARMFTDSDAAQTNAFIGVRFRISDPDNYHILMWQSKDSPIARIGKFVNGSSTYTTVDAVVAGFNARPVILVVANGQNIKGYIGDERDITDITDPNDSGFTLVADINDTFNQTATKAGMRLGYTGYRVSEFRYASEQGGGTVENPPTAVSDGNKSAISAGSPVTMDFSGSSAVAPATIASYNVTQVSGDAVTLTGSGNSRSYTAPSESFAQDLVFQLIVTDSDGVNSSPITFTHSILAAAQEPVNQPPTANAGPDQSVAAGVLVQVSASGSSDGDGTIVGWKWRETTNSGVVLSSTTAENISFTSPVSDTAQTVTLELIVTDDKGLDSAPVYVDFNVAAEVDTTPPVIILTGGNIALNVGEVFQEPGYQAFNNKGVDITSQVTVTGSTSTAFPRTGTLEYNVVADGIAAETQTRIFTVTAESELLEAVSKQKFLRDNTVISAFTGRSNIEELKFQLASTNTKIALDNQGYYDFDENETQKVIVVTDDGEISSDNGDVEWEGSSLFVRFGAFSSRKSQLSARVVVFLAGDKRGVVIAGPGLNANLLVKFN